ncbi:MAG: S-4TM family putative pore-forming effector [Gemmatimonadetes bacterium]|nr:S-4TM family putative pore-forming effector [Gemmatimonadota bacterium]
MSIQERQNQPKSLAKLAAQRLLYQRAKWMRNIDIVLILIVVILGLSASVVENQGFSYFVLLVSLITWFLDQQVLKRKESASKKEAATIQEDFDCFVLNLPWPAQKGIQYPTPDRVRQLTIEAKSKPKVSEGLRDWYPPDSIPNDPILSKIHCQRMNSWWDVNLRRSWSKVLKVSFWIFAVSVLCLSVLTGITVAKLIAIIASNIRVLAWGLGEIKNQDEAIERVDRIHRYLSRFSDENSPSPSDIRSIQDEIFEHRRSNPPVPDWFYWRKRDSQEQEAAKPYGRKTT